MSAEHKHQLYELQHKDGLVKGKKTKESSKKLGITVAALEAKTDNSSNNSFLADHKPKAVIGII